MKIKGEILAIETIAEGHGICKLTMLRQRYGQGNWRKFTGTRRVVLVELN